MSERRRKGLLHNLLHRHTLAVKNGMGTFGVCAWRLGGRCTVEFRPDYSGASWHLVPPVRDSGGTLLFEAMMVAATAEEAMALLRAGTP